MRIHKVIIAPPSPFLLRMCATCPARSHHTTSHAPQSHDAPPYGWSLLIAVKQASNAYAGWARQRKRTAAATSPKPAAAPSLKQTVLAAAASAQAGSRDYGSCRRRRQPQAPKPSAAKTTRAKPVGSHKRPCRPRPQASNQSRPRAPRPSVAEAKNARHLGSRKRTSRERPRASSQRRRRAPSRRRRQAPSWWRRRCTQASKPAAAACAQASSGAGHKCRIRGEPRVTELAAAARPELATVSSPKPAAAAVATGKQGSGLNRQSRQCQRPQALSATAAASSQLAAVTKAASALAGSCREHSSRQRRRQPRAAAQRRRRPRAPSRQPPRAPKPATDWTDEGGRGCDRGGRQTDTRAEASCQVAAGMEDTTAAVANCLVRTHSKSGEVSVGSGCNTRRVALLDSNGTVSLARAGTRRVVGTCDRT